MPLQPCCGIDYGKVLVAIWKLRGKAHVALSIDGIVVVPIGDRRDRNPCLEAVGVSERVEGKCAAPAPSPPAKALRIELWVFGEHGIKHQELILELHRSEVVISGLGKGSPTMAAAAIVGMEHGEPMLSEQFVEEKRIRPLVLHYLGAGSAVGIQDQGHAGLSRRAGGEKQRRVKSRAIVRLHFKRLGRAQMEGFEGARRPKQLA